VRAQTFKRLASNKQHTNGIQAQKYKAGIRAQKYEERAVVETCELVRLLGEIMGMVDDYYGGYANIVRHTNPVTGDVDWQGP
jgi:hypothetical protein